MAPRKSAHAELDQLEQRIAAARLAEREAEQALLLADAGVEAAREDVREAHDLGADPKRATGRLEQAKKDAEQAALAREGIAQRVRRATADRDRFMEANGDRLLEELRPECSKVVEDMRAHAEALLADHVRWGQLQATVSRYLLATHASPAANAPGSHELAPAIKDLKRLLGQEIASPAPNMTARTHSHAEQAQVAAMRREREQQEVA